MPAMASGGIVSFQEGGRIGPTDEELLKLVLSGQPIPQRRDTPVSQLTDKEVAALLSSRRRSESEPEEEEMAEPAIDLEPTVEMPPPPPPAAETTGEPVDALSSALEQSLASGLGRDAATEGREARREAEEYLNVKEEQDRMRPYLERMRAAERSPQEQARERLIASLTNMAGRSTPGMALAGGARGGINALASQRAEERQSLQDQMGLDQGIGQLALGARQKALEAGSGVRGDVEAGIRQAQSSGSNVIMARAQKSIADDAKLMNAFSAVSGNRTDIIEAASERLAEDPEYQTITMLIGKAMSDGDTKKLAELRDAEEAIKTKVMGPFLDELKNLQLLQQRIGGQLGLPELSTGGQQGASGSDGWGSSVSVTNTGG